MKKYGKFVGIFLAFFLLVIGCFGCGGPNGSSSSSNSSTSSLNSSSGATQENNYYDARNFLKSDKIVSQTKTRFYEGPSLLESSSKVKVNVEGNDLFVYEARVNHARKFTYDYSTDTNPVVIFDFEGRIHIEIEVNIEEEITSCQVSPLVYGIKPTINDNKISFDLEYTDNYIVEYNGDSENVIHLFTNSFEENPITEEDAKNDSSIIYIGPGIYEAGAIPVKSNSTIYIAGGAVVYGQIRTEDISNVVIKGRGIISGSEFDRRTQNEYTIPVEIRTSNNIVIEDLTFLDPAGWCFALYKSSNITLNNVKIITSRANGDGISVQSCSDVKVNGGFVRSWDDSLVVKNVDRGTTKNVIFDGVTVWTDLAQSMEVGYETYGPTMDNVRFQNITVVHNFHKPVISLHNCDDAEITNVYYQNITVEDGQMLGDDQNDGENDFFIDMTIAYNVEWTKSAGDRGSVDGVTIDNVKVYEVADTCISRLSGESVNSKIKNINISNIDYASKVIKNAEDLDLGTNQYVEGVNFTSNKEAKDILGAIKTLPYTLSTNYLDNSIIKVEKGVEQEAVMVPSFAHLQGESAYIGEKTDLSAYEAVSSHGAGKKAATVGDDGSGVFETIGHEGSKAFDGDRNTYYQSAAWKNEEDEFATLTVDFDGQTKTVGVIRVKGLEDNKFKYTYSISVYGLKIKADGTINDKYTRILSSNDYIMSPANGNIIDINISTSQYAGLQIRMYRGNSFTSPKEYKISEVEFYPPSLSFGQSIYGATEHNDVYPVTNVVDGETAGTSYYESKELPAQLVIDLKDVYDLNKIILSLCPSLLWEARTQNIEIQISSDNRAYDNSLTFTTLFEAKDCLFDPQEGNRVVFDVPEGIEARYVKIIINSNSSGKYGAQLAEVSIYGN